MEQQQSEEAPLIDRAWQPSEKEKAFLAAASLNASTSSESKQRQYVWPLSVQCGRSWLDGALAHTGVLVPVTAKESYSLKPLGLCELKLLFCGFSLVPYISFFIKNWRRLLCYAKYQNPKCSLSTLFVSGKKNCLKWIQCFHNTSVLCTHLFAYLLARNSLHGQ